MSRRIEVNLGPVEIVLSKLVGKPPNHDVIVIIKTDNLVGMGSDVEINLETRRSEGD